jgi:predicted membrane protein
MWLVERPCTPSHQCTAELLLLQDLRPFDQALQVIMAIIIHLELFVTVKAVSDVQQSLHVLGLLTIMYTVCHTVCCAILSQSGSNCCCSAACRFML